ncbi:ATP-binding cassette domain-containing protein [Staphylococcus felis]|uniref:ATP-binding cassette domain-containing protein n=1 Tax=Staphylococcus felis TaxID=46127 RepID=UPI003F41C4B2
MSETQQEIHAIKSVRIEELSVFYHQQSLLQNINLNIEPGSFHCIIGESGSGKSLLTRTLLSMTRPELTYEGHVDIDLSQTDAVFQDANSNMFQNITIQKHFEALYDAIGSNMSRQQQYEQTIESVLKLGFDAPERLMRSYPFELSGGMAQRIAILMAFVRQPNCLILDEPTSALDVGNSQKLMRYLIDKVKEKGMTVIFVTHDLSLVQDYATHVSIMKKGQLLESGQAHDILTHPKFEYTRTLVNVAERRRDYVRG